MTSRGDWIILRTSPSKTLRLAESLAEDGFEVWTPVETRMFRKPRMNARREVRLAMLPCYVFARERHEVELLELASMPLKPRRGLGLRLPAHDGFTVIHYDGKTPRVADASLAWLRDQEMKRTPRKKAERAFDRGVGVRVTAGICQGMKGIVQRSKRGMSLICFAGGRRIEIPTSILAEDEAYTFQSAALKAA